MYIANTNKSKVLQVPDTMVNQGWDEYTNPEYEYQYEYFA